MTTIAYHHKSKTIAADSYQTMGSTIVNQSAKKIILSNGVYFAFTGKDCDNDLFIAYYFDLEHNNTLPECSALVLDNGVAYSVTISDDGNIERYTMRDNFAVGSGRDFALAAMDFGCTAKDAVKYAITRDIYSGGKVREIKVR